jgi:hypothetical protein
LEWGGIIRLGRYCGQQLMECVQLRALNLRAKGTILWVPGPNNDSVIVMPLGPELVRYLKLLPPALNEDSALFQRCSQLSEDSLLAEFKALIARAGLDCPPRFSLLHFNLQQLI